MRMRGSVMMSCWRTRGNVAIKVRWRTRGSVAMRSHWRTRGSIAMKRTRGSADLRGQI